MVGAYGQTTELGLSFLAAVTEIESNIWRLRLHRQGEKIGRKPAQSNCIHLLLETSRKAQGFRSCTFREAPAFKSKAISADVNGAINPRTEIHENRTPVISVWHLCHQVHGHGGKVANETCGIHAEIRNLLDRKGIYGRPRTGENRGDGEKRCEASCQPGWTL